MFETFGKIIKEQNGFNEDVLKFMDKTSKFMKEINKTLNVYNKVLENHKKRVEELQDGVAELNKIEIDLMEKLIVAVFYREMGRVDGFKKHEIMVHNNSVKKIKKLLKKSIE